MPDSQISNRDLDPQTESLSMSAEDERARSDAYWKDNVSLLTKLLAVWFVVSYGCGILFVDALNSIQLGGFQLGFWFAQQGAIYVFVALIFVYAAQMKKLAAKHGY